MRETTDFMTQFRRTAILFALFSSLIACPSFAGAGPTPAQQTLVLPQLSPTVLDGLKAQDVTEARRRLQIGVGRTFDQLIAVNARTAPASTWTILSDGWRVWAADISSAGALGVRVHLESLKVPEGARLLIYDPAKPAPDTVPITAQTLAGQSDIWSETVFSERVIVECQLPPGVDPATITFSISGVSHIFTLPSADSNLKEGTCEKDATCYPAWANEASGVARISFVDGGNTYLCTGCLLADNNGSGSANYFLTANHCIRNQNIASSLELFWFYQTGTCNGAPPAITSVPHTSGADFLAGASASDFSFLRLRQAPPSGAAHLAWSTDPPPAGGTLTGIHHPTGAYKRISFGRPAGSDSDFWAVQWNNGVTEPGSSGSPMFNDSHQVIGQLNGGFNGPGSSCNNPSAPDQYGRFDVTYNSIKRWLGGSSGGQATFVKGTYTGLFQEGGGVSQRSSGSFTLTVSTKGKFSAKIKLGAGRYSMSGQFDDSGSAQISINRRNLSSLVVNLQIDAQDPDRLTGTLSDGSWTANLTADRAVFDGRINIAPEQGQYTLVIPDQSTPDGNSYGTVTVDKAGHIRFSGSLADATKISQSVTVSKNGQWPLYIPLYSGQGFIFSWITFANTGTSDFSGNLSWIKPSLPKAKLYPAGFSTSTSVSGSRYSRPAPGEGVLNLTDATLVLTGGNLDQPISDPISFGPNSRVTNLGSDKLSLSFSLSSGLFSGHVVNPNTSKSISFHGVVLQKQNIASGYFAGIDQSGQVVLSP